MVERHSIVKILHVLSQRPDSTGSGIYIQAMPREAAMNGHQNFLVAGIQPDRPVVLDVIAADRCRYVRVGASDVLFPIVGMSDVMPYASSRFRDFSQTQLQEYEVIFASRLKAAVKRFQPKIMKQSHLFVLPSFYEGLPLVLLEGLASGCRILATDLPGVIDLLGDLRSDFIDRVKTPRLRHMDQPYARDEKPFECDLARALKTQIDAAVHCPDLDLTPVWDKMAAYTWTGIFQKVQKVYGDALKRQRATRLMGG